MTKSSNTFWNVIATVVFLALNIFLISFASDYVNIYQVISGLNWLILFILGLGVYRLTDVICYEDITKPFRDLFTTQRERGFTAFMQTMINCNACTGVWVAMIVFYGFLLFPIPTFIFMAIMTLTGLERFFSKIYNFLERR